LRKAFFIVKKLPISRAAEGRAKPRNVGRLRAAGYYQCVEPENFVAENLEIENLEPENTIRHPRGQVFPQTPATAFRPA
jgi:hypothetical protein